MSRLFFLFLIWFEGNFILEQSDKQQLSSSLSFGPALISFPFYCLFDDGQAFVKLLFQLPSNRFLKNEPLFEQRNRASRTSDVMPPSERSEGHMWFCFSLLLCLCEHAVLDLMLSLFQPFIGSHWVCAWRCSCRPTISVGFSPLLMLLATSFVLSRFSLPLLVQPWKFFC